MHKLCEKCGAPFSLKYGRSAEQWARQRYCSLQCNGTRKRFAIGSHRICSGYVPDRPWKVYRDGFDICNDAGQIASCEFTDDAQYIVKAVNNHDALMRLSNLIREIREEQTSDAIFGGTGDEKRKEASRIYASRILAAADKIDDVLAELADA